jgi:probable HAF family extracellular repeat protein
VGSYRDAAGLLLHGFLLDNGSYTTLDVPGSSFAVTYATGINASGQIVGWYDDGRTDHGFLYDNGSYTTLDVPGSILTHTYGINASGQIVGSYGDASGGGHGFLATPVP